MHSRNHKNTATAHAAETGPGREDRRQAILSLLRRQAIRSQAELSELLAGAGIEVNQATLSRDLRDLGLVKGPAGYEVPAAIPSAPTSTEGTAGLFRTVRQWLHSAVAAQNLVVLRTPPGAASTLAVALDQAGRELAVGTIAGDDTVLAVCATPAAARRLARQLLAMKESER
ncbi:MAG: arginine repressor [Planctomycetes bacterium]|nr:arginine repressor [Planctomycetota bacterium]